MPVAIKRMVMCIPGHYAHFQPKMQPFGEILDTGIGAQGAGCSVRTETAF